MSPESQVSSFEIHSSRFLNILVEHSAVARPDSNSFRDADLQKLIKGERPAIIAILRRQSQAAADGESHTSQV